ncbi:MULTISPECIES: arylsulfatase [unclassified Bradyrhizobium]|uniref:arylsulfatase n=1 Tax=unclassified Bradyrhizobium TaxID=2631580 RepID=UPI0024792A6E|nr:MULTISPECIES: arylsulfatase [unclassified Bradyrhizobium]WGR70519.1 arylsulfatase [Bradyrhizobium sp. ISRA426]WGR82575.1 arylsulfatase [Bradyrhizobium sp. ISRA430]WGR85762.1 arylsulfatase [Bradyrhizobium sp. ISRA432]
MTIKKKDRGEPTTLNRRSILLGSTTLAAASALAASSPVRMAQAQAQQPAPSGRKPNILVIWGDDIGIANISAYSNGLMGYETPNIDRIAREGIKFQHYYGEQSCTAGRSAFLTGQHIIRTGLSKVGFPGAPMGMSQLDPSIGGLLKNLGYATGQFGKNHVGDRNPSLPTVNGFDEFFGNLYHLNAEEEPELPDYPKDPAYRAKFGPRGVLRCKATEVDDPTVDPRFGKIGKQTIEDTGALTKKRMETIDDETSAAAIDFMKRQQTAGKPFFVWFNSTRMHLRTHVRAEHRGRYKHGDSEYIDGMQEHDDTVGSLLKALDDMGVAGNTIVVYSSDNGPHMNTWPDGAMTWFRSEKNTNWEGAFRVPCLVRWPGVIRPGTVTNELMSHNDWIPTLCSIAGEPDIVNKLKAGYTANGVNYKVHLDGYDQSAFLRNVSGGAANNNGTKSARNKFFYSDDDGLLVAMRLDDLKYVFSEQRMQGTMGLWAEPFTTLRLQKIFNLMQDPFERADITSNTFWDWQLNHVGGAYGMMDEVFQFVTTFKDFPPRSFPPSFNPANVMEGMMDDLKTRKMLKEGLDPEQVRGALNRILNQGRTQ